MQICVGCTERVSSAHDRFRCATCCWASVDGCTGATSIKPRTACCCSLVSERHTCGWVSNRALLMCFRIFGWSTGAASQVREETTVTSKTPGVGKMETLFLGPTTCSRPMSRLEPTRRGLQSRTSIYFGHVDEFPQRSQLIEACPVRSLARLVCLRSNFTRRKNSSQ